LMALEMRNRLKTELGIDIPIVEMMGDFSIMGLTDFLNAKLVEEQAVSSASVTIEPREWEEL